MRAARRHGSVTPRRTTYLARFGRALACLSVAVPSLVSAAASKTSATAYTGAACANAEACFAVGYNSTYGLLEVAGISASGHLAHVQAGPASAATFGNDAMACPSPSNCLVAAGTSILSLTVRDGVLGSPRKVPNMQFLTAIACISASQCYAGGTRGSLIDHVAMLVRLTAGHAGAAFAIHGLSGSSMVQAIGCAAQGGCLAAGIAGTGGFVARIAGGAVTHVVPSSTLRISGIACPGATTCIGVGTAAGRPVVVALNPATGSVGRPVAVAGALGGLNAVACHSATACVAVGEDTHGGWWTPIAGTTPGRPTSVSTAAALNGIACESATACVAVGESKASAGVAVSIAG